MKTLALKFTLLSCLMSLASIIQALEPGDRRPPPTPIVASTQSFELTLLNINLGLDGKVNYIEALGCPNCEQMRFKVNKDTKLSAGDQPLSIDDIYLFNKKSADIVFDPDSLVLREVRFHVVEEE